MTIDEMQAAVRASGALRQYRLAWDIETEAITVQVRKPVTVRDGLIRGHEIVFKNGEFTAWSHRKKLLRSVAFTHKLTGKFAWEGEAEITVPGSLADRILPMFGAKVKRVMTEAQKAALDIARTKSSLSFTPCAEGVK